MKFIEKIDRLCLVEDPVSSYFETLYIGSIQINPFCAYVGTSAFRDQYYNWFCSFVYSLKGSPFRELLDLVDNNVMIFFYLVKYYYGIQWTGERTILIQKIKKKEKISKKAKVYLRKRFNISFQISDKIFSFVKEFNEKNNKENNI